MNGVILFFVVGITCVFSECSPSTCLQGTCVSADVCECFTFYSRSDGCSVHWKNSVPWFTSAFVAYWAIIGFLGLLPLIVNIVVLVISIRTIGIQRAKNDLGIYIVTLLLFPSTSNMLEYLIL